jgi:hypothetical protein
MENNLNAKTIGQNQAVKSKFLITIPIIPVIREVFTEYKEESLTMNVFGCSIPGMNTPPVVVKQYGMQIKQNGNETTFDDFEFSFAVDDWYVNWGILNIWNQAIKNHENGTGFQFLGMNGQISNKDKPSGLKGEEISPYINVTITALDNFDEPVMTCTLNGAFITMLSPTVMAYDESGEEYVKSTAKLSYDFPVYRWNKLTRPPASL